MVSANAPIKNCFFIFYSPMVLTGFQSQVFWGSIPQVGPLKFEVQNVQVKFLAPQGETGIWGFPPEYMALYQGWDLWQEYISIFHTCFSLGAFSFTQCVGITQLFLDFSQRELWHVQLYIWYVHGKREIQELPMSSSWSVSNVTNLNYLSFPVYLVFNFNFFK